MTNFQTYLICFSHLRWTFVFKRPEHLMSRFARHHRVYFIEEPVLEEQEVRLRCSICPQTGVRVITPVLAKSADKQKAPVVLRRLIEELIREQNIRNFIAWYYTPMAIQFTDELTPELTVYDCMDELSAFANAAADMIEKRTQALRTIRPRIHRRSKPV